MTAAARKPAADAFIVSLGTCLLFFDFGLYSLFAVQIAKTFFPPAEITQGLIWTFAIFALSFLTRPIGAWLFGRRADTRKRSSALALSFLFMGGGALAIALTPSYATIGLAAPALLILSRLAQGLAAGGEPGPAIALLVEMAPPGRKGLFGSVIFAGQLAALAMAGLLGLCLQSLLSAEAVAEWGWRLCFLLSAGITPFGVILRNRLQEKSREAREKAPSSGLAMTEVALLGLMLGIGGTLGQYLVTYMTTFLQVNAHLSLRTSMATPIILGVTGVIFCTLGGLLTDRFGLRSASVVPRVAFLVIVAALLILPVQTTPFAALGLGLLLAATHFLALAVTGLMVAQNVAASQRATTVGVVYAVAVTLFGGTAHMVFTWLIEVTAWQLAPLVYVGAANALSLYAAHRLTRPARPAKLFATRIASPPLL